MTEQTTIDTADALPAGDVIDAALADQQTGERDYEAEARHHGWTPKEDFKGDPNKWVDAETFARRADEVMPFLQKQNKALKRDIDELKRTMKQANEFYSKAEERAYNRALAEVQAKHDEAVETGDVGAARKAMAEMRNLDKEFEAKPAETPAEDDSDARRAELAEWVEATGWYGTDEQRTKYADMQADLMGPADKWDGGQKAWLSELTKRTERKFADPKPSATNAGGARPTSRGSAKSYNDLPADAKRLCDRFVKSIPGFTKEQYVKDFDWN